MLRINDGKITICQIVTSSNESLRKRVEAVLDMAVTTVSSLTESFSSTVSSVHHEEDSEKNAKKGPSFDVPQDASTEAENLVAPDVPSAEKPVSKSSVQDDESNESDLEVHG